MPTTVATGTSMPCRRAVAALLVALLTAGCSGGGTDVARLADQGPSTAPASSAPPAAAWGLVRGRLDHCGPQPARVVRQHFHYATLHAPGPSRLPAAWLGRGRMVAVLLHQTSGAGMCGWLGFAERIARDRRLTALMVDLCGYGKARCSHGFGFAAGQQRRQISLAIDYAEQRLHARRIVLVGASMGGSLAVIAAARDHRVDALVDLSGPTEWRDAALADEVPGLDAPVLYAMADTEGPEVVAAARALAGRSPAGSVFVAADSGHGYELLEDVDGRAGPLAPRVLDWIRG